LLVATDGTALFISFSSSSSSHGNLQEFSALKRLKNEKPRAKLGN
jgi:hypothetical protein